MTDLELADAYARIAEQAQREVSFPYASRFTWEQVKRMIGEKIVNAVRQEGL